eukprot:sb/3478657/
MLTTVQLHAIYYMARIFWWRFKLVKLLVSKTPSFGGWCASRVGKGGVTNSLPSKLVILHVWHVCLVWFGSLSRPGAMLSCSSCAVVEGTTMTPSASGRV